MSATVTDATADPAILARIRERKLTLAVAESSEAVRDLATLLLVPPADVSRHARLENAARAMEAAAGRIRNAITAV